MKQRAYPKDKNTRQSPQDLGCAQEFIEDYDRENADMPRLG